MTLKVQKRIALCFIALGIALGVLLFFAEDAGSYKSGLLSGFGCSLTVIGLIRFFRIQKMEKDPEKAQEYEVSIKDERIAYIANKARSLTFILSIYAELATGLIALFVFNQQLLGQFVCMAVCFQCLLFVVIFYYYKKKY